MKIDEIKEMVKRYCENYGYNYIFDFDNHEIVIGSKEIYTSIIRDLAYYKYFIYYVEKRGNMAYAHFKPYGDFIDIGSFLNTITRDENYEVVKREYMFKSKEEYLKQLDKN